jgi:hypothetical protein
LSAILPVLTRYSANDPQFPVNDRSPFTGKSQVAAERCGTNGLPTESTRCRKWPNLKLRWREEKKQLAIGKNTCGVKNDAVFPLEVCKRHGMNFIGSSQATVIIIPCKGEACVGDEIGFKSEIACHSNSRLDRIICAHAGNYERLYFQLA